MNEKLLGIRKTLTYEAKEKQQEELFSNISRMLFLASFNIDEVEDENDMFDIINRLDGIEDFLKINKKHIACLNPDCNYATHARFFRATDTDIWLHYCPCCQGEKEAITLAELVLKVFKAKYPKCNHKTIVQLIKRTFSVEYSSEFHREMSKRIDYNLDKMNELDNKSNLAKLIKKRRLDKFYGAFGDIAVMYSEPENDYSFYASRSVLQKYFIDLEGESKSNSITEKVNLLADLGFITKLNTDEIPAVLRSKVKFRKDEEKYWLKDVTVYQTNKITDEQLIKAEEYAKAIINNKIYRNKVSLEETIKDTCSFTKDEIKFLDRAKKAIDDELKSKGYIALSSLVSKIDKKGKYYKKDEKQKLLDLLQDRVLLESNLKKIKATETNKKKYNMKRVVDKETILIRSEKVVEIADRILVEESVRLSKQEKSKVIKAKKASSKKSKSKKSNRVIVDYKDELERLEEVMKEFESNIVRTYTDSRGYKIAVMKDGSEEEIDIPF